MAETTPSKSYFPPPPPVLNEPSTIRFVAIVMTLAVASLLGGGWQFYVKPMRAAGDLRYQAHLGLMRLYDMQTAYKAKNGTFANDLDTLLASAPDGAELREKLKACVDINTVTVVGNADRFRLEINILDGKRTPVKLKGETVFGALPTIYPEPQRPSKGASTKQMLQLSLGVIVLGLIVVAWQRLKPKRD